MSKTREEVIRVLVEVKDKKGTTAARDVLRQAGKAHKFNNVDPVHYDSLWNACDSLLRTGKFTVVKDDVHVNHVYPGTKIRQTTMHPAFGAPYGGRPDGDNSTYEVHTKHARSHQIDHRSEKMTSYHIGLPGDLAGSSTVLVIDTANLMAQKLLAKQDQYGDSWRQVGWNHEGRTVEGESVCRHYMFQHMLKGDPIDVANFAAMLAYHGWSSAPQEREEAKIMVEMLQKQFDLLDDNALLRDLMDKMEERHGEEFNAFFEATLRQIMIGSGMTELTIDTKAVLQTLVVGGQLVVAEAPGKLIYRLVEDAEVTNDD